MKAQELRNRIAENVKSLREARGWTQDELAAKANLSEARAVSRVENTEHSSSLDTVVKLASAFEIDPCILYQPIFKQGIENTHVTLAQIIDRLERYANSLGIEGIISEKGKLLQIYSCAKLARSKNKQGTRALDESGNACEIRIIDLNSTKSFLVNYQITEVLISEYKTVNWIFATFSGNTLTNIYSAKFNDLKDYFGKWKAKLDIEEVSELRNPKIPSSFILKVGTRIL